MRLLDWNHVQTDYHSLLCTHRSIHHAGGLRCYLPEAYLGGPLGHALPLAKKFFFTLKKKLENLVGPLLCKSTSGQRKFGPPFRNPKYATATYMSDESKRGHVALTFQNCKRFSVETRLQASKETESLDVFTGWMECEYLIMPSLQPMSKIFRFIIKQQYSIQNANFRSSPNGIYRGDRGKFAHFRSSQKDFAQMGFCCDNLYKYQ